MERNQLEVCQKSLSDGDCDGNDTIRKHPVTFRSESKNDSFNTLCIMTSSSPFQFQISLCLSLTREQVIKKSQSMDIKKKKRVLKSLSKLGPLGVLQAGLLVL